MKIYILNCKSMAEKGVDWCLMCLVEVIMDMRIKEYYKKKTQFKRSEEYVVILWIHKDGWMVMDAIGLDDVMDKSVI